MYQQEIALPLYRDVVTLRYAALFKANGMDLNLRINSPITLSSERIEVRYSDTVLSSPM